MMGRHTWMARILLDMVCYSERNGLTHLHAQLCEVLSSAMLSGVLDEPHPAPIAEKALDNILDLSAHRRKLL